MKTSLSGFRWAAMAAGLIIPAIAGGHATAAGDTDFILSSPAVADGGALPDDLKCSRAGGDGLSPPLEWVHVPDETAGYVIVMQHYPRDTTPGVDVPSHYWLLWNVPESATGLARGNPDSVGHEGGDKDMRATGYTPPCSPSGAGTHEYTITVYAVDEEPLGGLPDQDDSRVDWSGVMAALEGHVTGMASISFVN